MSNKKYQKPTIMIETMEAENFFCASQEIKTIKSTEDTGITYGGGGSEEARSRSLNSWGIEDD